MTEQLRNHIEHLFQEAPKTRAALDLKEELMANSIERYNDLTAQGITPENAYQNVIGSIGNVDDLFDSLAHPEQNRNQALLWRRRSALITSLSVGLYILAAIVFLYMASFVDDEMGLIVGLAICIAPTCMLIYNAQSCPAYVKTEETVVEDFKQWNQDSRKSKAVRGAASSVLWIFCLVAYFLISFSTGAWHITWVIFLVTACAEGVLTLVFSLKELK